MLNQAISDFNALQELRREEEDEKKITELVADLLARVRDLEAKVYLRGRYDEGSAFLTIRAGAGGTDAQDWAQMLLRMYVRFAEQHGWRARVLHCSRGQEAGIKEATIHVAGNYAYGFLRTEAGVHRLVRRSPFNAKHLRQTSFASVEVVPNIPAPRLKPIPSHELAIQTFRASGAGGQYVNKTSSAVRIRHLPTGITVQCQNERSQAQNKAMALRILQSKLYLRAQQQHRERLARLRGERLSPTFGQQIRSYVLEPYRQVKDHRTGMVERDVEKVLDGELDDFIRAALAKGAKRRRRVA